MLAVWPGARLGWGLGVTNATLLWRRHGVRPGMPAERRRDSPSGLELAGLGLFLATAVVVPLLAGIGVDAAVHSSPVGLLTGLCVGVVAAATGLWLSLRRFL